MPDDLAVLDATAQAELVGSGQALPIELVDAAIKRVEELNGGLNAVVTPLSERARAAAEEHLPDGPLRGVPFALKDLLLWVAAQLEQARPWAQRRPRVHA
jgi:amidase